MYFSTSNYFQGKKQILLIILLKFMKSKLYSYPVSNIHLPNVLFTKTKHYLVNLVIEPCNKDKCYISVVKTKNFKLEDYFINSCLIIKKITNIDNSFN